MFALCLCASVVSLLRAADGGPGLSTPVTGANLDAAAFAEWCEGQETALTPRDAKDDGRKAQWVIWTDKSAPGHSGLAFGASKKPGPRHLRVGFTEALEVGSILIRGGVQVSALKPGAAYPGDLADGALWIKAERIRNAEVCSAEASRENYVLWTLPEKVKTRSLRFSHNAEVTDKDYAGWLGGAYVLPVRLANMSPQAVAHAGSNEKGAQKVANEHADGWEQWSNIDRTNGQRAQVVSPESPEWLMLIWSAPVKLRGVGVCFAGFADAEVQTCDGPAGVHPREAPQDAWKTVKSFAGLTNRYPVTLPVDWLDFGQEVSTRALRLRITKSLGEGGHPHVQGHAKQGKRVWLGELLALQPLDAAPLSKALLPKPAPAEKPPIAVKFTLPEPGWVTLVIDDAGGKRMRNLIADTFFEKGENTVWWDGSDDLGRDPSAAAHGLYFIPTQLVGPGQYRVRGLWHKQVDLRYEFGVYSAGSVPWETADKSGGWLANHTPPSAVLFVPNAPDPSPLTPLPRGERGKEEDGRPCVMIGSYVSEGTAGLAWVDLDGKKWRGQGWVGGLWTGAPYLARDAGPRAVSGVYAYAAAAWSANTDKKTKEQQGEIRITALTAKEDKSVLKYNFKPPATGVGDALWEAQIGGLAVYDGLVAVSLPALGRLLLVDAHGKDAVAPLEVELASPQGLAFDGQGRLLALSGTQLVRFAPLSAPVKLLAPEHLLSGLEAPHGLALDAAGNIYVSERGQSHQVKVYSPDGKPLRSIGKRGAPQAGPYDPLKMQNPRGVTVDSQNRIWVAEEDSQPKRVSVWSQDGTLLKAFYGPAEYGGGGSIDPEDKTRFYYHGMEFKLDWAARTAIMPWHQDQVASVYYRPGPGALPLGFRSGMPESAVYVDGRRYFTNAYNSNPTNGNGTVFIFIARNGIATPVAAAGRANEWPVLKDKAFAAVWPQGTDAKAEHYSDKAAFFLWCDLNADGQVQPDEVQMCKAPNSGGITVMRDLSIVAARLNNQAVRFAPARFSPQSVPLYELASAQVLVEKAQPPPSSGCDQALVLGGGWSVHTNAPQPYSASGLGGVKDGTPMWSYPSLWPGLHASHNAPVPDQPGMVIGTTRLLGNPVSVLVSDSSKNSAGQGQEPRAKSQEPLWMLNGNHGPIYVFTADGLFVAQLLQDMRLGRPWAMPAAERGMLLNSMTPSDENFWPSVTQTKDGAIYLMAGRPSCIVRVDGLDTIHRLDPISISVTEGDLDRARAYFVQAEAARQAAQGRSVLKVAMRATPPEVDGKLEDWPTAEWADIDKRGTAAYFDSNAKPYNVTGAVAIAEGRLYAAWRTGDKDLLRNSGDVPNALFKTGGALDLMVGSDAAADPKRTKPVAGDLRLLVTQVKGATRALLYRAVVADDKQPVPFSSPGRTVTFDRVDEVSAQVQLAGSDGNYELAVPLAVLGLKPAAGQALKGDLGILRGSGTATTQRVYWSNKATAIVADVPSEAELCPHLWGRWEITKE